MKRVFDIIFSVFAIIFFLPLILLVGLVIKITDKDRGEVIFRQKRLGLNGKEFTILKFRTMYKNSDEILKDYLEKHPEALEELKKYGKLKSFDPRVTPIGKFLRKTSLDELLQFFNVLKGDMSIVGPRPYIKEEFKMHNVDKKTINKLLSVRPGMTGLWQTSKRNEATFEERIKQDLEYIENRSFWIDLKIIIKTVKVIFTRKGAY